jgi:hypothetical protein
MLIFLLKMLGYLKRGITSHNYEQNQDGSTPLIFLDVSFLTSVSVYIFALALWLIRL